MYVRFVLATDYENPWRASGVITSAYRLREDGRLFDYQVEVVDSAFDWFNQYLPVPPFQEKIATRAWTPRAVCWFISQAREPIYRIWDLIAVIRDQGLGVQIFREDDPGKIVYRDDFQVVAEIPRFLFRPRSRR